MSIGNQLQSLQLTWYPDIVRIGVLVQIAAQMTTTTGRTRAQQRTPVEIITITTIRPTGTRRPCTALCFKCLLLEKCADIARNVAGVFQAGSSGRLGAALEWTMRTVILFALVGSAYGADAADVVAAIHENSERLRSGEFSATGEVVISLFDEADGIRESAQPREARRYSEHVLCRFDFDNDLFSFRRERLASPGTPAASMPLFWYVSSPGKTVFVTQSTYEPRDGSVQVEIRDRYFPVDDGGILFQPLFDPRSLGFVGVGQLHGMFDQVFDKCFPTAPMELHDEGAGILRLTRYRISDDQGNGTVRSWWCDTKQALQPIKYSLRRHRDESYPGAAQFNARMRPSDQSEVTWIENNGVWLPKSVQMSSARSHGFSKSMSLEIEWRGVNHAIDVSEADWQSWNLPKRSVVSDFRLHGDRPVTLAIVGQRMEVEFRPLSNRQLSTFTVVMCAINGFGVGLLLGWMIRRAVTILKRRGG